MAMADPNPIPPYAITCWTNGTDIFVALPMTLGGTPYITKYPLNEGGLSMAIAVLRKQQKEHIVPSRAAPANYTLGPQPQVQTKLTKAQVQLHSETTPEQRERARLLLETLGIKR